MIDGSVLQSAQRCFEKKSRVVVKMVVNGLLMLVFTYQISNREARKNIAYSDSNVKPFYVQNLMQMAEAIGFVSYTLGLAYKMFDD